MLAVKKKFGFRKSTEEVQVDGKIVEKEVPAPAPIEMEVKLLELPDVVNLLKSGDEKVLKAVVDTLNSPILSYIRELIDTYGVEDVRSNGLPADKYSFETIANLPPASKAVFDEATWSEFKTDYMEVVVANGVGLPQAKIGAEILATRLIRVKSNLPALNQFRDRIRTWYTNSSKQEQMLPVYEYLIGRCEGFIASNQPETILASF